MKDIEKVVIKDMGVDKHFTIHLFGAMAGLDFIDKHADVVAGFLSKQNVRLPIKDMLADLLPLATHTDASGEAIIARMSLDAVDTYFQNPLAALELGFKIFQHQMVFMREFGVSHGLNLDLESMLNIPTSDSATQ